MDIPFATIFTGFLVSTVGFSLALYGKKQLRVPQLVAGGLLMLLPFVLPDAVWMSLAAAGVVAAMWLTVRANG
jgi:hypothetical protein